MRLTGRLVSVTPEPFVSRGTPSRKYRTELPDIPLMDKSKSEPTPPSSLSFTPAVRSTNPLNELMLLTIDRTSMAFTERAPSRSRWVFDLPVTVTLSSITESFIWLFRRLTSCPYAGTNISRQSDSQSSLSFNSLIFKFSAQPYSRGLRFLYVEHGRFPGSPR